MLKILVLLFISTSAFAETEIGVGGLSYHLAGSPELFSRFSNKTNSSGSLIRNDMLTFKNTHRKGGYYESTAVFIGENSVGSLMSGLIFADGTYLTKNIQMGLVYGAYLQDNREFTKREINNQCAIGNAKVSLVPIIGLELNLRFPINKRTFIKLNNIVTPTVTNHTLSINVEF